MAVVVFIVHLFFLVEVLSEPHCNKDDCPASVLAASSYQITGGDGQELPPGLQECLPYLLCSQDAIKILRTASVDIWKLHLTPLLRPGRLDELCRNVEAMLECEKAHWKDACDTEIGSKGRKSDTKFAKWLCDKRWRLEKYSDCWGHPSFSKRLFDCVEEYTDVGDISKCFEQELEPEQECSDGAIAFVQTMAVKFIKPS